MLQDAVNIMNCQALDDKWDEDFLASLSLPGRPQVPLISSVSCQDGATLRKVAESFTVTGWIEWMAVRMVVMLMWNGYRSEKGLGVSQARAKSCSKSVAMANYPVDSWMLVGFAAYLSIWFSQYNLHLDVNIAESTILESCSACDASKLSKHVQQMLFQIDRIGRLTSTDFSTLCNLSLQLLKSQLESHPMKLRGKLQTFSGGWRAPPRTPSLVVQLPLRADMFPNFQISQSCLEQLLHFCESEIKSLWLAAG